MKTLFSTLFVLALSFTSVYAAGVSYEYDELNRLTKVIYDDGTTTSYAYDSAGNRTVVTESTTSAENGVVLVEADNDA